MSNNFKMNSELEIHTYIDLISAKKVEEKKNFGWQGNKSFVMLLKFLLRRSNQRQSSGLIILSSSGTIVLVRVEYFVVI